MFRLLLSACLLFGSVVQSAGQDRTRLAGEVARQRAAASFAQLREEINKVDEPLVRALLRSRVVNYLWGGRPLVSQHAIVAMTVEALDDADAHKSEVPSGFRNDLLASLELHAPATAERFVKRSGKDEDLLGVAFAMLDSEDETRAGLEKLRAAIRRGQDAESILPYFVERLEREDPNEASRLLSDFLTAEEARGSISPETLQSVMGFYLSGRRPTELRTRFLRLVAASVANDPGWAGQNQRLALDLLRACLPAFEQSLPSLAPLIAARASALATDVSRADVEQAETRERLMRSSDPVSDLLAEADKARDPSAERDDLLGAAAGAAMDRGDLQRAVEIITILSSGGQSDLLRDSLLAVVVAKALARGDVGRADFAVSKMSKPSNRVEGKRRIAGRLFDSGDIFGAQQYLGQAVRLVDSEPDHREKAFALAGLVQVCGRLDEQRLPELARAMVKELNALPEIKSPPEAGRDAYDEQISETLVPLAWKIIPAFQTFSMKDEQGALGSADDIQPGALKAAAFFGATMDTLVERRPAPK